jgi:hypothetical protein
MAKKCSYKYCFLKLYQNVRRNQRKIAPKYTQQEYIFFCLKWPPYSVLSPRGQGIPSKGVTIEQSLKKKIIGSIANPKCKDE